MLLRLNARSPAPTNVDMPTSPGPRIDLSVPRNGATEFPGVLDSQGNGNQDEFGNSFQLGGPDTLGGGVCLILCFSNFMYSS